MPQLSAVAERQHPLRRCCRRTDGVAAQWPDEVGEGRQSVFFQGFACPKKKGWVGRGQATGLGGGKKNINKRKAKKNRYAYTSS